MILTCFGSVPLSIICVRDSTILFLLSKYHSIVDSLKEVG